MSWTFVPLLYLIIIIGVGAFLFFPTGAVFVGPRRQLLEASAAAGYACERRPVMLGIPAGDRIQEIVAQDAGEGQRHVGRLARGQRQADILEAKSELEAG